MFTDPIQFYFVKQNAHGPLSTDLAKITDQLGTYAGNGLGLKREVSSLIISYDESPIKAVLRIEDESKFTDKVISNQMILTCERNDSTSVNLLRNIIKNMGYRIFNPEIGAYNSSDPDLLDLTTLRIDTKVKKIMEFNGFTPLFNYRNNLVFFAQRKDSKPIYQVNSDLLLHIIEQKSKSANYDNRDFSIKVAQDIGHFIALYDRGMIQGNFYANQRKIFNHSNIELKKLKRDIFIRPIFFKYNDEKQSFDQFQGHSTRRVQVKNGGSVDSKFIKKLLTDFKIDNKFLMAKVQRNLDYEEDDNEKLIPRINMVIFID